MIEKAKAKVQFCDDGGQIIFCPGCDSAHRLHPGVWTFNGDVDCPTFAPSLLFTSGHYVSGQEGQLCWCTFKWRFGRKAPRSCVCRRCHSFVRNGMIEFLPDTSHHLAGQTVPLPVWPYAPGTYAGIKDA